MRIALIGCMVMNREINHLTARSSNIVRTWWLRQGLHDTPELLRANLQQTIDSIEAENQKLWSTLRFDAIVLAYGLCSNGVIGLQSRSLPLIVPRCDDCISLFLGSSSRYRTLFEEFPGTYWYNRGWIEQAFTPSRENYAIRRAEYAEEYGEDNADFLMENAHNWMDKYQSCCYITCPLGDCDAHRAYAKKAAEDFNWIYREISGDLSYLDKLVNGPWDDESFLSCPPGNQIIADYSGRKFECAPY